MGLERPRLEGLDALRGMAALVILAMHTFYFLHAERLIHHGYLAVDFFFILSGFVLAKAYQPRLQHGFAPGRLIWLRIVRLYPMILLGTLLGTATAMAVRPSSAGIWREALSTALLIPRFDMTAPLPALFPIDSALWSLFWEMIASIAFAMVLHRWSDRALRASQCLSLLFLAFRGWHHGSLELGFSPDQFADGALRVGYGFTTGLLLQRHPRCEEPGTASRIAFPACALLIVLFGVNDGMAWLYDLVAVTVVFPAIVRIGSTSRPTHRIWAAGGALSYPLYVLHLPIVTAMIAWHHAHQTFGLTAAIAMTIIFSITAAELARRFYEEPMRRYFGSTSRDKKEGPGGSRDPRMQPI